MWNFPCSLMSSSFIKIRIVFMQLEQKEKTAPDLLHSRYRQSGRIASFTFLGFYNDLKMIDKREILLAATAL